MLKLKVKIMKGSDGGGDPHTRLKMLKNMAKDSERALERSEEEVAPHGFGNVGGVHSVLGS